MKNLQEVLKEKEAELARLNQEVEALRLVARLLTEDSSEKNRSGIAGDSSRDRAAVAPKIKVFP